MGRTGARAAVVALAALALALALVARAPARAAAAERASMRPGVVLVGFRPGVAPARRRAIVAAFGRRRGTAGSATVLRVRRGRVRATVRALRRRREVRYAEPDYAMRLAATPDDPAFPQQWAPPMDHTTAAWDVSTGTRSVVIGEADSGVEYTHPDLAANIWSNPGNVGGCPAGTHGYNVIAATCDPMDDETFYNGHGTHVAGILGAIGNNGMGVAGVNWSTTILPVKWTTSGGGGSTSDLITALEWFIQAKQAGVNLRVVNDSAVFVGTPYSQALSDEIDKLGANDILFVTAAGNTGDDNDDPVKRRYPCGYDRPTEICVAATDDSDRLPTWANYGVHTVDLAAPGGHIFSTLRNGSYGYVSGSSMASPQVAGTAALMLSRASMSATQLKAALLASVDRLPVLDGLVRTGGRLNVCRALPGCSAPANPPAPATFGTTTIGSATATFGADRKRVSPATLTEPGRVTKLRLFVEPGGASGQETLRGVVYADAGGAPGRLLGTTGVLAYDDGDTSFRGWWDLSLPAPLSLPAGRYWLGILSGGTSDVAGFRWESTAASGRLNSDIYADGASDPFGAPASTDAERMSLYAIYTPSPANTSSPPPTTTAPSSPPDTVPSAPETTTDPGAVDGNADTAGGEADHAPACVATSPLAGTAAHARGRALALSVPGDPPVDVAVLRESPGAGRIVERFAARRAPLSWTTTTDGVYVVRFTAGADQRQVVVERRAGRFRTRPAYRMSSACGTIRLFALDAPLFGGRAARALAISYRLGVAGRVEVRVLRSGRTVRRYAPATVAAGRLVRLRLGAEGVSRGDARVVLRVTAAGRTATQTLTARRQ